jgi:hypothetical protein
VYATFDGHDRGDYAPYVYVTEDYGQKWRRIDAGLPQGWSVNVITEHPRTENLLFVGNEVGVYVSTDRGEHWTRLKGNLPTVPVDDIAIHPRDNDLLLGTHGRSAWIMADVTPLEALASGAADGPVAVFPTKSTVMWAQKGDWPFYGATYSAPNPPRATPIRYALRDSVEGGVKVVILNSAGQNVRTLDGPGEPGLNEVLWDWRHDRPYEPARGGAGGRGGGRGGGVPQGPVVLPGTYTARVTVGGQTAEAGFDLVAEPRRPMTVADRAARQDILLSLHELAAPLYEAGQAVQRLTGQMDDAKELLEAFEGAPESLTTEAAAIRAELEAIGTGLAEVRGWAGVAGDIQASSTLPTADQRWQVDSAWRALPPLMDRLNALITTRVPAFNEALDAEGVRPDPGNALVVPRRRG